MWWQSLKSYILPVIATFTAHHRLFSSARTVTFLPAHSPLMEDLLQVFPCDLKCHRVSPLLLTVICVSSRGLFHFLGLDPERMEAMGVELRPFLVGYSLPGEACWFYAVLWWNCWVSDIQSRRRLWQIAISAAFPVFRIPSFRMFGKLAVPSLRAPAGLPFRCSSSRDCWPSLKCLNRL